LLSTKSQAYVPNSIYTVVPDVEMWCIVVWC
jgi:hypothetical protein